jgi:hypothetical protein
MLLSPQRKLYANRHWKIGPSGKKRSLLLSAGELQGQSGTSCK